MPYIRAVLVQDEAIEALLAEKMEAIRKAFAECSGYNLNEIALVVEVVPEKRADNLLPLEFVVDTGILRPGSEKYIAPAFKDALIELGFRGVRFGIWIRVMVQNEFVENQTS